MKKKIDALAWHGRLMNVLPANCIQEALMLYKKTLLPPNNADVRNSYIKFRDHRSNGIVSLVNIVKSEAMQEKMVLSNQTNKKEDTENSNVQRRIF